MIELQMNEVIFINAILVLLKSLFYSIYTLLSLLL
jgi:hypothetical protein